MSFECLDWDAWYDSMPGPEGGLRILHIAGTCDTTQAGYRFDLEVGNQGISPNPLVILMRLSVHEPDFGPDVLESVAVKFEGGVGSTYRHATIRGAGVEVVKLPIRNAD